MIKQVTNVQTPEPDPEATKKVFKLLEGREQWSTWGWPGEEGPNTPIIPPTDDPPVDNAEPPREEPINPLPVAEVDASVMAEQFSKPEPQCGRCGGREQLRRWGFMDPARPELGVVYFCQGCWAIMEP
jgi:hypothetical protein